MLTCAIRPAGIYGERDTTITFKLVEHASKASRTTLRMQVGNNNNLFDFTYVGTSLRGIVSRKRPNGRTRGTYY